MIDKRKQIIEILPYDSNWPLEFEKESVLLKNIFADNAVAVHHIGRKSDAVAQLMMALILKKIIYNMSINEFYWTTYTIKSEIAAGVTPEMREA